MITPDPAMAGPTFPPPRRAAPGDTAAAAQPPPAAPAAASAAEPRPLLAARFRRIRTVTGQLAAPLTPEDQMVQSAPETSPVKWHLAHTSWFLERHVLERFASGYRAFDDRFAFLFNTCVEPQPTCHPAAARGLLSRPGHEELRQYRDHVNAAVLRLIDETPDAEWAGVARRIELALQHEQYCQERLLADAKHAFWSNPLRPTYQPPQPAALAAAAGQSWMVHPGGPEGIGHDGSGVAFDLEEPRHVVWLEPFRLSGRLVTNAEYLEFIEDGGYADAALWDPEGWTTAQREGWRAPLYWFKRGPDWFQFTLSGTRLLDGEEPVCHVSWYEAAAFARWDGRRLPTEAEWEVAAQPLRRTGNLLDYGRLHPAVAACAGDGPWQLYGDCWEWTSSPLVPYPRWSPSDKAVGEHAGLPAAGRMVLKGGSALTPGDLVRASFRHHLTPSSRWHMTGIRLAEDV
ncbi:ergothioneine biosynthesis protein EgtB [Rhodocista pekingensis]|uniref:Ergothioneine biosynthesis protein EgtB n=1 Tax=Rhodocista pekingensis TaxID=201185 RepID=A0ABW2KWH1_9PROT